MSKLKEQLEVDIKRFLENIENQNENDKLQTLRNLFDKYLHLSTSDYLMDHSDLFSIISSAKKKFSEENVPIKIGSSKRTVSQQDLPNFFVIEATVGHLNRKGCLKKLAKFDKKKGK